MAALWCPSDASITGLKFTIGNWGYDGTTMTLTYTSYAGSNGTFDRIALRAQVMGAGYYPTMLSQANGVFSYIGYPTYPVIPTIAAGVASISPTRLASITDGTSNTFAFSERAHGKLSNTQDADGTIDYQWNGSWTDGADEGSFFTSMYYINPFGKMRRTPVAVTWATTISIKTAISSRSPRRATTPAGPTSAFAMAR